MSMMLSAILYPAAPVVVCLIITMIITIGEDVGRRQRHRRCMVLATTSAMVSDCPSRFPYRSIACLNVYACSLVLRFSSESVHDIGIGERHLAMSL